MPSLNDLKNDGNYIPSIKQDSPAIPTLTQGSTPIRKDVVDLGRPKGSVYDNPVTPQSEQRTKADFSSLPEKETLGVDIRESITKDILGPGGPFEKAVAEQKKEALEWMQEYEVRKEAESEENQLLDSGEEIKPTTSNTDDIEESVDYDYGEDESEYLEDAEDSYENAPVTDTLLNSENLINDHNVEETEVEEEKMQEEKKVYNEPSIEEIDPPTPEIQITTMSSNEAALSEDDLESEAEKTDDMDSEENQEMRRNLLKKLVTEKIKPVSRVNDFSGFTVSSNEAVYTSAFNNDSIPVSKWVLYKSKVTIAVKEIKGSKLEAIRNFINRNDEKSALQIIYDHIVSPKPNTFDAWLKTVAFDDYDHIFMAIYIAAFADSNYMPGNCKNPKCVKKVYLTDNLPIFDLVKFKNKAVKAEFDRIYKEEPVMPPTLNKVNIIPISKNLAVGFKIPTLYSTVVEGNYLDQKFIEKHETMVRYLPYIERFYHINYETRKFDPIRFKTDTNNVAKTIKSKVVTYDKILETLSSDEMSMITSTIDKMNETSDDITYHIPETTCPYCGHVNAADDDQTAASLVFLRNQLARIANT